jgi:hypothetical protein
MATYNFNITGSRVTQSADIAAGESTVFSIANDLTVASYFTLETVQNQYGQYDTNSKKNTSGSFTLGSGLSTLIQSDYIASVIVEPGGGDLTFVPAIAITGSTLYLRGTGA